MVQVCRTDREEDPAYIIQVGKPEGKNHLGDIGVEGER
jgi:hypothetical protein